ncbi:hypothetical protein [Pseudogulbenkiania ferrooxidans]|uniref:Uncharacterized protein n=1 Tax=Pseudogulbenkiania ferrooxidans 2002 TaxID=279714 RepID=B9Z4W2_9NEIS|nr:hypothetical protein [Pseudogulbenkiania ferrooxidans]EEG08194.1 hypothetical protein FuraDRAFT_2397 [Pseudogulbenkiania ferrooxidans 2002]
MSDITDDILAELLPRALTASELLRRPRLAHVPAHIVHDALDALVDVGVLVALPIERNDSGYLVTGIPLPAPADEPAIPAFLLK